MLTEIQKDILRYAVTGKSATERKAIGLDDNLALQAIAEYVEQQAAPMHDMILARQEENLTAQLADVQARKAERVTILDLISQLSGE